jgi:hypothetical protein
MFLEIQGWWCFQWERGLQFGTFDKDARVYPTDNMKDDSLS